MKVRFQLTNNKFYWQLRGDIISYKIFYLKGNLSSVKRSECWIQSFCQSELMGYCSKTETRTQMYTVTLYVHIGHLPQVIGTVNDQ